MTLFDYLEAYLIPTDGPPEAPAGPPPEAPPELSALEAAFSPADAWLTGAEFAGEAPIGGDVSGTWDSSGEGAHVISVGTEVLDLPPY